MSKEPSISADRAATAKGKAPIGDAPSIVEEVRRLFEAAGLNKEEADRAIFALIRECVDISMRKQRGREQSKNVLTIFKESIPQISEDFLQGQSTAPIRTRGLLRKISREAFAGIVVGVAGNAAFAGLCTTIEYLWAHGWVLFHPDPHLDHIKSILDMPYDNEFASRLPPLKSEIYEACRTFATVFKSGGMYRSYIIRNESPDTNPSGENLSSLEGQRRLASIQSRNLNKIVPGRKNLWAISGSSSLPSA